MDANISYKEFSRQHFVLASKVKLARTVAQYKKALSKWNAFKLQAYRLGVQARLMQEWLDSQVVDNQ